MLSAYQQLLIGLAFSIVLIYLLIVVNFQSWLDPFVIIMALPGRARRASSGCCSSTHTTFVRAGPDRRDHVHGRSDGEQHSGRSVSRASSSPRARTRSRPRWRRARRDFGPVLMTALAMIIGMAPMAIEAGQNAPLGRAVIGGLLFATFATLLFVPTRVCIVHRRTDGPAELEPQPPEPLAALPSARLTLESPCPPKPPSRLPRAAPGSCFSSAS